MRYLSLSEVLKMHRRIIASSGGTSGIRDLGAIESALAQPRATFGGQDLYPTITEKAGSLCFSLIGNHGFLDGNKRIGHAAMEVFLYLNGYELDASTDEQEEIVLGVAAGKINRSELTAWIKRSTVTRLK
jgi:death on curing protein